MRSLRLARWLLLLVAVAVLALSTVPAPPGPLVVARVSVGSLPPFPLGLARGWVPGLLELTVTGIGALVAGYAARNLAGQARLTRFAALECVAVAGLATAVGAPSLLQLGVGWTVGGLALAALVGHSGTAPARDAARGVAARLLVGDLFLWLAVVVIGVGLHTLDLGAALTAAVDAAPATTVTLAATLVVVAGAVRSSLVPAHRWLPETAYAPSPVSALLHAGLVNGVGVLALLLWPVLSASLPARLLLGGLAVTTALLGTAQVRARADVKGRLAGSTTAQMGYLGLQAALGLPAAALAHLVGHGLWKASAFLGAGGAVERARAAGRATAPGRRLSLAGAATVAAVTVLLAAWVPGPWGASLLALPAEAVPVALAAVGTTVALRAARAWTARAHSVAIAATLLAPGAYLLGLRALTTAVDPTLYPATPAWGTSGAGAVSVLVVALAGVGALGVEVDRRARCGGLPRLVSAVARTALPPGRQLPAPRVVLPVPPVPDAAAVQRVRATVTVAADLVGPLWPLESFVATNPLAGLEGLAFPDALAVATSTWGSRPGPGAAALRAALAAGRLRREDLVAAVHEVGLGAHPPVVVAGATWAAADVVVALLLHDDEPTAARSAPPRAAAYPDHLAARRLGGAAWPQAGDGVWAAMRADRGLDAALGVRGARDWVAALPPDPAAAVAALVDVLGASEADRLMLLGRVVAASPGWPAHLAWRAAHAPHLVPGGPEGYLSALTDLLAVRLAVCALVPSSLPAAATPSRGDTDVDRACAALAVPPARLRAGEREALARVVAEVDAVGRGWVRTLAWERAVRTPLLAALSQRGEVLAAAGALAHPPSERRPGGPDAQVVTCIDVRSERLRRHLEGRGPWETVGAAGFFGLPVRHVGPDGVRRALSPAPVAPTATLVEQAPRPHGWQLSQTEAAGSLHAVEAAPFTPFALAEAAGWLVGPLAALRTVAPAAWQGAREWLDARLGRAPRGTLAVLGEGGMDLDDAVDLAEGFLRSSGLLEPAPLVVLCGHGGAAANNPHVAAYDCGACGGHPGDVNARAMAAVLNDVTVRDALGRRGLAVPTTTWFAAALHDTTRDSVHVLADIVPASHADVLARLRADLARACTATTYERVAQLPQAPARRADARRHVRRRAADWAQVRPEWGLAGNSALVIGPRGLTAGLDLGGRVFLQSYRPDTDPDGTYLEALLAGPLVVAQWINLQYWCATVDADRFGAGDKTTHNVVLAADGAPHLLSGVLTGPRGDLRMGLPWQALAPAAPEGGQFLAPARHDPVRLLAVVCAPRERVDAVLRRLPHVAALVGGGWLTLAVLEPQAGSVLVYDSVAGWRPMEASTSASAGLPGA